jgi:SNF2 family DNA or RNA helicase
LKTKPMAHQEEGLRLLEGRRYFGLFCEQGTGKTWIGLADAERAFGLDKINGLLVVAPKGVHTNWTRREVPTHLSAPYKAAAYRAGSKTALRACQALNVDAGDKLRILAINVDALNFKEGFAVARSFLQEHRAMMIVDESHRIKTPTAGVTKRTLTLGRMAIARRIATGTPLTNSPPDLYSQFEFLRPELLGTNSYRAFVARYAELLPDDHGTMRHIRARMMQRSKWAAEAAKNNKLQLPQIVARDASGAPRWRNLEELRTLLEPHTYRVLKRDCLDLPEKIYQTRYFDLSPALTAAYTRLQEQLLLEVDGDLLAVHAFAARLKLQQLTSGFVIVDGVPRYIEQDNPRLALLREVVTDQQGPFIIWATFREEIAAIMRLLAELEIPATQYHGDVKAKDREDAVDGFQEGRYRAFVGQPGAGGIGLTLTAAESVIYYSNDFNYGVRAQSEDRAHRKGTVKHVVYIDLVASDTIDESIASALQRKEATAAEVLGDAII